MMKNVVLIGFMGTGKSCTGKMLANRLGCAFIDLDQFIEREEGQTIAEIFAEKGEAYFRACEKKAVREVISRKNTVIATGGGTVKDQENFRALKDWGAVICLKADVDVILRRTSRRGDRPVLDSKEQQSGRRQAIEDLLKERQAIYEAADCFVDTGSLSPWQVVDEIVHYLRRDGI